MWDLWWKLLFGCVSNNSLQWSVDDGWHWLIMVDNGDYGTDNVLRWLTIVDKLLFVCLLNREEDHPSRKNNLPTETHCVQRILPKRTETHDSRLFKLNCSGDFDRANQPVMTNDQKMWGRKPTRWHGRLEEQVEGAGRIQPTLPPASPSQGVFGWKQHIFRCWKRKTISTTTNLTGNVSPGENCGVGIFQE